MERDWARLEAEIGDFDSAAEAEAYFAEAYLSRPDELAARGVFVENAAGEVVGSCIAWGAALNPNGPINALLSALGGNPQPFLTSPDQALACIIVLASWIGIGYWMLFLISGLQAIRLSPSLEVTNSSTRERALAWASAVPAARRCRSQPKP